MKKITLIFIALFTYVAGYTQFYKSFLPSPNFTSALEKIVLAYRVDYRTIQVDSIYSPGNDYETYGSSVKLPGALNCQIIRFHSAEDSTAAFQANFYDGDDFNEAAKIYDNCVMLIKKSRMRWVDRSYFTFNGKEETASQNIGFTVSVLRLNLSDDRYKDYCAEVEISRNNVTGWQVNANFHLKHSDTEGPTGTAE